MLFFGYYLFAYFKHLKRQIGGSMKKNIVFLLLVFFGYAVSLHATVGGPEIIEILGLDKKEQKIYILRHYKDESGEPPQLYYVSIAKTTELIEVKSFYEKREEDFLQFEEEFNTKLEQLKARLLKVKVKKIMLLNLMFQQKNYPTLP